MVKTRAAAAFTDAFNVASAVSIGLALAAAVAVLILSRPRRDDSVEQYVEDFAEGHPELDFAVVPVGSGQTSE